MTGDLISSFQIFAALFNFKEELVMGCVTLESIHWSVVFALFSAEAHVDFQPCLSSSLLALENADGYSKWVYFEFTLT